MAYTGYKVVMPLPVGLFILGLIFAVLSGGLPGVIAFISIVVLGVGGMLIYSLLKPFLDTKAQTKQRLQWERENADRVLSQRNTFEYKSKDHFLSFMPSTLELNILDLFQTHGYHVYKVTYPSGKALKAVKENERAIIKWSMKPIVVSDVLDLYECMAHDGANLGFYITTSKFTESVYEWVKRKNIVLIDGDTLQKLLDEALHIKGMNLSV
jgi:hypothetical protein